MRLLFVIVFATVCFGIEKNSPPYEFSPSTRARATQVNANFDSLDSKCDQIVDTLNGIRNNIILDTTFIDTGFISELVFDSATGDTSFITASKVQRLHGDTTTLDTAYISRLEADTTYGEQVHINKGASGASAPTTADELVIETGSSGGLTILTGATGYGNIFWGVPSDAQNATLEWDASNTIMKIGSKVNGGITKLLYGNTQTGVTVYSDGNVGISEETPAYKLDVAGSINADDSVVCDSVIANRVITNAWNSDTITADTAKIVLAEADTLITNNTRNSEATYGYYQINDVTSSDAYTTWLIPAGFTDSTTHVISLKIKTGDGGATWVNYSPNNGTVSSYFDADSLYVVQGSPLDDLPIRILLMRYE